MVGSSMPSAAHSETAPLIGDGMAFPSSAVERERLRRSLSEHHPLVWRSVRRFGVPESLADDATQQVFLALAARLGDVELGKERAFLLASAVRVAANARRKLSRSPEIAAESTDHFPGDQTPEDLLQRKQQRMLLDQALATLPID